ncbi:hypothetical protein [Ignavibacterium sp.]|uniref:hypothetical protein n=1 Tax=Ignavibacterium sp. TaxID=2651167 RepID=UPI002603A209|nr:hypothetical protein [Ignavibacterium sp.]
MKNNLRLFGRSNSKKENLPDTEKTISRLQRQEKIMTIAIYSLVIITTISIMLIIFILLLNE